MLNPQAVDSLFRECLFDGGQDANATIYPESSGAVMADGITHAVYFDSKKLDTNAELIRSMLKELPTQFFAENLGGGGGWSFLQACEDRNGNRWTGSHEIMQQLFLLGMGIRAVVCMFPRNMWHMMPGGMPYYVVTEV